jgi:hypothetical protein
MRNYRSSSEWGSHAATRKARKEGKVRRTWRIAPADAPEKTVTVRHQNLVGALQEARDRHFGEDVRLVAEEAF